MSSSSRYCSARRATRRARARSSASRSTTPSTRSLMCSILEPTPDSQGRNGETAGEKIREGHVRQPCRPDDHAQRARRRRNRRRRSRSATARVLGTVPSPSRRIEPPRGVATRDGGSWASGTSRRCPTREQFSYWHEVICQAFVPLTPHRTLDEEGFAAKVETRRLARDEPGPPALPPAAHRPRSARGGTDRRRVLLRQPPARGPLHHHRRGPHHGRPARRVRRRRHRRALLLPPRPALADALLPGAARRPRRRPAGPATGAGPARDRDRGRPRRCAP